MFFHSVDLQAVAEALTGGGGTGSATGDAFAFGGDHNSIQRGKCFCQLFSTCYNAPYVMVMGRHIL